NLLPVALVAVVALVDLREEAVALVQVRQRPLGRLAVGDEVAERRLQRRETAVLVALRMRLPEPGVELRIPLARLRPLRLAGDEPGDRGLRVDAHDRLLLHRDAPRTGSASTHSRCA